MPEAPASVLSSYAAAVQAKSFMDPVQTATVHDKEVRHLAPSSNLTQLHHGGYLSLVSLAD